MMGLGISYSRPSQKLDGNMKKAIKALEHARGIGFRWSTHVEAFHKCVEEFDELSEELRGEISDGDHLDRIHHEIGDCLFTLINLAIHLGIDPAECLDSTSDRFLARLKMIHINDTKSMIDEWNEHRRARRGGL